MDNKFTNVVLPWLIIGGLLIFGAIAIGGIVRTALNAKPGIIRIENDRQSVYYKEVSIDGCQYIIRGQGICHKGNCTNHVQHAERP
jgi:hypothetical protein